MTSIPTARCAVPGCEANPRARGLCALHYSRWLRTGDPGQVERLIKRIPRGATCSRPDCAEPVRSSGLCRRHYDAALRVDTCSCGASKRRSSALCRACHITALDRSEVDSKACTGCGAVLPIDSFAWRPNGRGGYKRRSRCRTCESAYAREHRAASHEVRERQRASRRRADARLTLEQRTLRSLRASARKLGLDPDVVVREYEARGRECEICHQPSRGKRRLHIDHCHTTGVLRGFLCSSCNTAIGHLGDDPARLRSAAEYLERIAAHP